MRSLTAEDLLQLRRVGDPQLSPDGQRVAYTEQYVDPETRGWKSHIMLVPADGSAAPVKLAEGKAPRWAPGGRYIAYNSDKGVSLLDLMTGSATPICSITPADAVAWSPDSKQIAFSAWTRFHERDELPYPGAPAPAPGTVADPDRPRVVTRYDHKQDGKGYYGDRFRQIYICAVEGGEPVRFAPMEANCDFPSFSPDGSRLAFVVSGDGDRHFFAGSDLWLGDIASGQAQRFWRPRGHCSSGAVWSGDGTRVALVADNAAYGSYSTTAGLWELDVTRGTSANLTAIFDREVGAACYSDFRLSGYTGPTWTSLGWVFLARSQGQSHVYTAPKNPLTRGAMAVGGYSFAAGRLAYQAQTPAEPDAIYVDGRVVARPGGFWNEVSLRPARRFTFQGAGGLQAEGWVMLPEGAGPHPAILCIHGGPHNAYGESFHIQFQLLLAAGYGVVAVNPRGSQSYGQEFAAGVCGDWGGQDAQDIQLGLDAAIALGGIDPNRIGVTGWSYGGYMTNRLVTRTNRFKAAVSGACIANLHSYYGTADIGVPFLATQAPGTPWGEPGWLLNWSPLQEVQNVTTPVLLLHGEDDLRCPVTQSEEFYLALKALGKTAVMVRYPGEPHAFGKPSHNYDRYRRLIAWFDHYVR